MIEKSVQPVWLATASWATTSVDSSGIAVISITASRRVCTFMLLNCWCQPCGVSRALKFYLQLWPGCLSMPQNDRAGRLGLGESLAHRGRDVIAQLVVGDSKNTITLARSSADVSPPYGFMLLPGTTSSGFAMKRSSFSLSHTKSAPFMALE